MRILEDCGIPFLVLLGAIEMVTNILILGNITRNWELYQSCSTLTTIILIVYILRP